MTNAIVHKSGEFLKSVLANESEFITYFDYFEKVESEILEKLSNSNKMVVWINIYNALMQIELKRMHSNKVDKSIFSKPIFFIAGQNLSLDIIEHGILRKNKLKQAFGFLPGFYVNSITKKWMCDKLDARIHFLLNCGAASCPVINVLTLKNLENQLQDAQSDFIETETKVDPKNKRIIVSQLFLFYRKDFGGKAKVGNLIRQYFPFSDYKLVYKKWDWSIQLLKIK
jgi:hypothetical protein